MKSDLLRANELVTSLRAVRETINVSLGADPVARGHVQDAQRMLDALIPDIAFQFGDMLAALVDGMSDEEIRADMIAHGEDPEAVADRLQAMAAKILAKSVSDSIPQEDATAGE